MMKPWYELTPKEIDDMWNDVLAGYVAEAMGCNGHWTQPDVDVGPWYERHFPIVWVDEGTGGTDTVISTAPVSMSYEFAHGAYDALLGFSQYYIVQLSCNGAEVERWDRGKCITIARSDFCTAICRAYLLEAQRVRREHGLQK